MVCRELAVKCKPRAHHFLLLTITAQNDSATFVACCLDEDTHL